MQKESPKLVDADHDALVEALKGLTSKLIGRAEVSE
jgi:hypothetical protein